MPPFNGKCGTPEQKVGPEVVTLASKRSGHGLHKKPIQFEEAAMVAKRSRFGPHQKPSQCDKAAKGARNSPAGAGKLNFSCPIVTEVQMHPRLVNNHMKNSHLIYKCHLCACACMHA